MIGSAAMRERFSATVLAGHKQAAVEVPFDPAARWSVSAVPIHRGRRGFAVQASIAGHAFDSFVVARSRRFWLLLRGEQLIATGATLGDSVAVSIEPVASRRGDDTSSP